MVRTNKFVLPLILTSMLATYSGRTTAHDLENSVASAVDAYVPLKGTYVWGEGVEAFIPCGQDKAYWIFPYTDEMWARLRSEHENLSAEPYGSVYIEINGVLGPKLHPLIGGEYAADFDGHVVIESIDTIRRVSETDCKP